MSQRSSPVNGTPLPVSAFGRVSDVIDDIVPSLLSGASMCLYTNMNY
jgi:hypothetical protein